MEGLGDRPGFLIRRAHQISQSVFIEECSSLDITSTQFGILAVLARAGQLDQISVARLLGFDRSTTGLVVKLLEDRALVVRTPSPTDGRKHVLRLTPAGEDLRRRAEPFVDRVRARLEGAFTPKQAVVFFELLDQFTRSFDETARVPLRRSPAPYAGAARMHPPGHTLPESTLERDPHVETPGHRKAQPLGSSRPKARRRNQEQEHGT